MNCGRRKETPGPPLFRDFGKASRDLLTNSYSNATVLNISSHVSNKLNLNSAAMKSGNVTTGAVEANYRYKKAAIRIVLHTNSKIAGNLKYSRKFLPSTKVAASLKFSSNHSNKLSLVYLHKTATLATCVYPARHPVVKFSATVGTASAALGFEAKYKTSSGRFSSYNAGISITEPHRIASMILSKNGDLLTTSYVHYFDDRKTIAVAAEVNRKFSKNKNSFAVGTSCMIQNSTLVKVRFNNRGKVNASLQQHINSNSCISISSEFKFRDLDKIPRVGFGIALRI